MNRKSIKQIKKGMRSRKNKMHYGGAKPYIVTIDLNLSFVDEELDQAVRLDPTILSDEYLERLESHLKDLVPTNSDFDVKGNFTNVKHTFRYNNTNEFYITFIIEMMYDGRDLTMDKFREPFGNMFEGDFPFTSEDENTYFITTNFDVNRDIS